MKEFFIVDNLSVGYDERDVLDDLSFSVSKKEIVAILCPNNCGKTTLIKTLSGIICKKGGNIKLNNIVLSKRNFKRYILNVGVVLEDLDGQFICDTVKDELMFPLINLAYKKRLIESRIEKISKIVEIDDILNKPIKSLTIFEKAKVLIAVSIIHLPKVLLLDDIFKFLDSKEMKDLFRIMESIKNEGISILFTTSLVSSVIDLEHIVVLGNNAQVMEGNFDTIIMQDNELTKLGLEIPLMIDLSRKLQFYNLVETIYYDVDKVVDRLWN